MEKAIEDIVRTYLRQETEFGPVATQSTSRQRNAQDVQASAAATSPQGPEKPYGDDEDSKQGQLEQEFMEALYQCLEEKGVLREVQAFIRQRLVIILKGAWPNLVQTKCDTDSHVTLALIQDFLCTHKLLFTFSIFTSELVAEDFKFRDGFDKMKAQDAEALLCELHVPKDSAQSSEILRHYFSKGHWSLLECIIHTSTWKFDENASGRIKNRSNNEHPLENEESLEEKLKRIDETFDKILATNGTDQFSSNIESIADPRIRTMLKEMEKDKEIQVHDGIQRFKRAELAKIRKELEKLRSEFFQKENQMLDKYEEKVARLQIRFDRERQRWRRGRKVPGVGASNLTRTAAAAGDFVQSDDQDSGLENFHQSLLAKYNDLNAAAGGAEPSPFNSSEAGAAGFGWKRQLERSYLLKEAALRNTIDKLTSENEQLKAKAASTAATAKVPPTKAEIEKETGPLVNRVHGAQPVPASEDEDARAFLQYTVECQAGQIENLQQQINELMAAGASARSRQIRATSNSIATGDVSLDEFLHESKRRFWEIEEEAQQIKSRMAQFHAFNTTLLSSPRASAEGGLMRQASHTGPGLSLPEPRSPSRSQGFPLPVSTFPTRFSTSTLPAQQRKVHFTMPPLVDINTPSPTRTAPRPTPAVSRPDQVQTQSQPQLAETSTDSGDSLPQQQQLATGDASASNDRQEVGVMEPIVIARKAYLTGALIRDKIASSSSDEREHVQNHSRSASNGQGDESTNGRGRPTTASSSPPVHASGFTSKRTPEASVQPGCPRPQPVKSLALSMLEDMEFETGKASSDDQDGLW